ncbi:hypothetical protein INE81_00804 [Bacteroides salyersiae]|nr:hypothetical protein INE81_00804 [Bacteroides salyersiae]
MFELRFIMACTKFESFRESEPKVPSIKFAAELIVGTIRDNIVLYYLRNLSGSFQVVNDFHFYILHCFKRTLLLEDKVWARSCYFCVGLYNGIFFSKINIFF